MCFKKNHGASIPVYHELCTSVQPPSISDLSSFAIGFKVNQSQNKQNVSSHKEAPVTFSQSDSFLPSLSFQIDAMRHMRLAKVKKKKQLLNLQID